MISSTIIAKAIKEKIKDGTDIESLSLNLIEYLNKNNLIKLYPQIIKKLSYEKAKDERDNTLLLQISHEFDEEVIENIKNQVERNKGERWRVEVDESLIAGFVIKGKHRILDASLKRNLELLKESLAK